MYEVDWNNNIKKKFFSKVKLLKYSVQHQHTKITRITKIKIPPNYYTSIKTHKKRRAKRRRIE